MLDKNKTEVIVAGPGVGKTTELIGRIERALCSGVQPHEIAFFSFSTTAVNEGLTRIVKRMNYTKKQFKYFKTLHAMAFSILGLNAKQVLTYSLLGKFAKENDLRLSSIDWRTGIARNQTPDSVLMSQIDSSRLQGMSIREYFTANHINDDNISKAEDLSIKYQQFKLTHNVVDFTDMLLLANETDFVPPSFKYMFIDEAQDLSRQQWKFIEKLAELTENIVVVGDERQAIADFAGADVDTFLSIEGKITTLDQSYRVPRAIYRLARKVEKHMIKTRNADWKPRPLEFGETTPGEIIRVSELPVRDMARGSWLVLTRTNSQLTEFKEYMMQYCSVLPTFFTIDGSAPIDLDVFKAITIFETIDLSSTMTKYDFLVPEDTDTPERLKKKKTYTALFKKYITSEKPDSDELDTVFMGRFGYKNWFDAFDKIPMIEKKYIMNIKEAYKQKPDAFSKSKIRLSTIHSAKGMEADNVVLYTAMTYKVYQEWKNYKDTNDSEAKVLFVGITRAKKKLYLLGGKEVKYSYNELLD